MPLEQIEGPGKYINSLNPNWPVGGSDDIAEGDNHIRGTKNVVVNSFPAVDGPVTASDEELSFCNGVTSSIQSQLDGKSAVAHNHDSDYSPLGHSHSEYAAVGHTHSEYAASSHVHAQYDAYEARIAALEAQDPGTPYVPVKNLFVSNEKAPGVYEFNKTTSPNKLYGATILNAGATSVVTVQIVGPGVNSTFTIGYTNSQGNFNQSTRAIDALNFPDGSYTATYRVAGLQVGIEAITILS